MTHHPSPKTILQQFASRLIRVWIQRRGGDQSEYQEMALDAAKMIRHEQQMHAFTRAKAKSLAHAVDVTTNQLYANFEENRKWIRDPDEQAAWERGYIQAADLTIKQIAILVNSDEGQSMKEWLEDARNRMQHLLTVNDTTRADRVFEETAQDYDTPECRMSLVNAGICNINGDLSRDEMAKYTKNEGDIGEA